MHDRTLRFDWFSRILLFRDQSLKGLARRLIGHVELAIDHDFSAIDSSGKTYLLFDHIKESAGNLSDLAKGIETSPRFAASVTALLEKEILPYWKSVGVAGGVVVLSAEKDSSSGVLSSALSDLNLL